VSLVELLNSFGRPSSGAASATPRDVVDEAPAYPQVKPRWLEPTVFALVVLAHASLAFWLAYHPVDMAKTPPEEIGLELLPQGDEFESEEVAPSDETPAPMVMSQSQSQIDVPLPRTMDPEAMPAPQKSDQVARESSDEARERRDAQERHRLGQKEKPAENAGVSKLAYAATLAKAVRKNVASRGSPGAGQAYCTFRVDAEGVLSVESCKASSHAHEAILRGAIVATHAPPPPDGSFFASQRIYFQ
jgi:periplasmic protein TonB